MMGQKYYLHSAENSNSRITILHSLDALHVEERDTELLCKSTKVIYTKYADHASMLLTRSVTVHPVITTICAQKYFSVN